MERDLLRFSWRDARKTQNLMMNYMKESIRSLWNWIQDLVPQLRNYFFIVLSSLRDWNL